MIQGYSLIFGHILYIKIKYMPKTKNTFFEKEGVTFDDILIIPQMSEVLPAAVNISTNLTRKIKLQIPIISADMDTVTESRLAIAMALQGGLGVIHKNLSPEKQAGEVKKVKRYKSGFIYEPITLSPRDKISEAIRVKSEIGYDNIPITENGEHNGVLVGLLTDDDYTSEHKNFAIKDRMTPYKKLVTAEDGITFKEASKILSKHKIGRLPIVNNKKDHRLVSMVTKTDLQKRDMFPLATEDSNHRLMVGAAVGPSQDMEERVEKLIKAGADVLVVSTAHGHSKGVMETVKYIKKKHKIEVIAGNIVTTEGAKALVQAGADAIKVGVGPGSICTTRVVAGVGVPQVTAILDCLKGAGSVPVVADGGIRYSGDIAKALALGASTVMLGSLLAGVEESAGEITYFEGKTYKSYRGMGSESALLSGSRERYAQEGQKKVVAQGIEGRIAYKGTCAQEIFQLIGGVSFALGYTGAENLAEFKKRAKFMKTTHFGFLEGHPHDVTISKEPSNYRQIKDTENQ